MKITLPQPKQIWADANFGQYVIKNMTKKLMRVTLDSMPGIVHDHPIERIYDSFIITGDRRVK